MSAATATENAIVNSDAKADRDIPKLNSTKKKTNLSRMVIAGGMILGVVILASGSVMFVDRLDEQKKAKAAEKAKAKPAASKVAPTRDFEAAKRRIAQEEAARMPPPAAAIAVVPADAAAVAAVAPPGGANAAPDAVGAVPSGAQPGTPSNGAAAGGKGASGKPAKPVETLAQRRMGGELLVGRDADAGAVSALKVAASNSSNSGALAGFEPAGGAAGPRGGFDDALKPSQLVAGVAAQRPDLNFLLRRGTAIRCVQKTRIVTTNPGPVGCQVEKDVYSANGKVKLMERGSEAFGELRSPLVAGQTFIPVLWSRIETPFGVVVDINSFGADALGASGQPIIVDNHVVQRFGGAVLLSLIGDIGQALSNKASEGEGTIRLTTSAKAGQDLANRTLESTINIPPTGYGRPGDVITIFVVRDIDFRSVYELARY